MEFSDIKVGAHIILDNYPCKIVWTATSRTKYAIKKLVVGIDIFTNKKYTRIFGPNDLIKVPQIMHIDYTYVDDNYPFLTVMDNSKTYEFKADSDIIDIIKKLDKSKNIIVTILSAKWEKSTNDFITDEKVIDVKEDNIS